MPPSAQFAAANWQKALPYLAVAGLVAWFAAFRHNPTSNRALFTALLVIYFVHQIEEHLWPGGFRQFGNRRMFHSDNDNWPVTAGGIALVNTALVWLPVGLAVLWPETLRWVGLLWVGLTLVNGIIHIATAVRLRIYNPGLVTAIVLFLPFTIFVLARQNTHGMLSGVEIALIVLGGVLLHIPVAALFVVPFMRARRTAR